MWFINYIKKIEVILNMKSKIYSPFIIIIFLFSFNLYGAASDQVNTNPDDFETSQIEDEVYDPIEPIK